MLASTRRLSGLNSYGKRARQDGITNDDISQATLDVLSELDQTAGWDDSEEDEEE